MHIVHTIHCQSPSVVLKTCCSLNWRWYRKEKKIFVQIQNDHGGRHVVAKSSPKIQDGAPLRTSERWCGVAMHCPMSSDWSILNNRLLKYFENYDIISKYKTGFRPTFFTVDNMFVLKMLIDYLYSSKKKLFCTCIDFKAAFDTINRHMLWMKLEHYCIRGNFLNVLKTMYEKAKSCVRIDNFCTDYFHCCIGVRQGGSLSPLLFFILCQWLAWIL